MQLIPRSAIRTLALPALAAVALAGCVRGDEAADLDVHYTRNDSELYAGLEHDAPVVSVLPFDTQVSVLETYRSFSRVRTSEQVEGWLPSALLLDQTLRDALARLKTLASRVPDQGSFRSRDTLNVHVEPYRWAPTFYQLSKDESFQVIDRMIVDRYPASAAGSLPETESTGEDYWYLVRVPSVDEAGWLLANMAYADVPLEIAALAQGLEIVAHFQIGGTEDGSLGLFKPTWLWFQSSGRGDIHDFDVMRVYQWDTRRRRYVVIRQVSGIEGYLPVEILPGFQPGSRTGFRILVDRDGQMHERTYAYGGRRVSYLGEAPVSGISRLAPPGGFGRRYARRGAAPY